MKFKRAYIFPKERASNDNPFTILNDLGAQFFCPDWANILNSFSSYDIDTSDIKSPFSLKPTDLPFEEIVDFIANEIISKYERIAIFYSGGVDSTLILASILKNIDDYSRVVVLYTNKSIEEYPLLYKQLSLSPIKWVLFDWNEVLINKFDYGSIADVILSGHGAGMVASCADFANESRIENLYGNWKDSLIFNYRDIGNIRCMDKIEQWVNNTNLDINSYYKMARITSFAFKAHNAYYKFNHLTSKTPYFTFYNHPLMIRHFFSELDKQEYEYKNKLNSNYKEKQKKYILTYNHDYDYFYNKGKVDSWYLAMWNNKWDREYIKVPIIVDVGSDHIFYDVDCDDLESRLAISNLYRKDNV